MDQKKTSLPYYRDLSKTAGGLNQVPTHLIGAVVAGVGIRFFWAFNEFPQNRCVLEQVCWDLS